MNKHPIKLAFVNDFVRIAASKTIPTAINKNIPIGNNASEKSTSPELVSHINA